MSEVGMKVEKETGRVKRVTDRIGKFLSETYTFKGAKAAELRKYEKLYASFTPSQQSEMMAYYDKKAGKRSTWKVIRNWVATGAGLALGYGLLQPGGLAAMGKWVVDALNVMGIQFQPVVIEKLLNPPLPPVPQPVGLETWWKIPFVSDIISRLRPTP